MNGADFENMTSKAMKLAAEVDELSSEVKMLSINLAIVVARVQNKKKKLKGVEEDFTELISRINKTTTQVVDVMNAFKNEKTLLFSLPASSKIIEQRGAYDKIEASLNYAYDLSQKVIRSISLLEGSNQVN
ncbi:MAG: hypothetical protein KAR42_08555 [candidate division Zixibacteria bacterium]|nr:hypothetical protein [candidate division Zixibacteria bacterium]